MTSLRPAAKIEKMGVIQILSFKEISSRVGEEIHHLVYIGKCYLHLKGEESRTKAVDLLKERKRGNEKCSIDVGRKSHSHSVMVSKNRA